MKQPLDFTERGIVLSLARNAVHEYLTTRRQFPYPKLDFLKTPSAAFVTLKIEEELRGCIGSTQHLYPLGETIVRCAISAATEDPRFPPLTLNEFPLVRFEVSILSEFTPIQRMEEIEPGIHGVMITSGYYKGLLLPQVARDHRWDRETFFRHVCQKAGLPGFSWSSEFEGKVEIFTAEVFGESDLSSES
jgi:AmmeMemoRadiSam system protein A